jgi:proline dehydrogenase
VKICVLAKERQVRLIIDAEYSWYQPAIDALTLSLMQQFNKLSDDNSFSFGASNSCSVQPLVYGTYQAYLRRTPTHLSLALQHAKEYKYTLGVKLVRGAYHPHELAAHRSSPSSHHGPSSSLSISPDTHPPVWLTKAETDLCYDTCARWLIDLVKSDTKNEIPTIGILFGTHNWNSCRHILDCLVETGLAVRSGDAEGLVNIKEAVTERITIGQLYGMSDALTNWLVETTRSRSPFVTKYVPYGALSEVMPYLCRRAIENKSVLASESGGAADERRRAYAEIRRRVLG